jgi:DNA polymerase-3 subunit beta
LVEGEFPDYNRIVPTSSATKITLDKDEFSQAVKIASVFARESANVIRFNLGSDSLQITANAPQLGHNQAQVEAKIEGKPLEIAFNYKFVSDFLAAVKGNQISIELNESLTPGLFRDLSDPAFTHVIMPVRLQD